MKASWVRGGESGSIAVRRLERRCRREATRRGRQHHANATRKSAAMMPAAMPPTRAVDPDDGGDSSTAAAARVTVVVELLVSAIDDAVPRELEATNVVDGTMTGVLCDGRMRVTMTADVVLLRG